MVQAPGTIHVAKREHFQSLVVPTRHMVPERDAKWLPHLGLNPSTNLPLQPHFWLLSQLATAASIPGRCGPVVWSQLSPSSSGPHYKSLFGPPSWLHPVIGPLETFSPREVPWYSSCLEHRFDNEINHIL